MVMTATEQADFIKGYLGPELRSRRARNGNTLLGPQLRRTGLSRSRCWGTQRRAPISAALPGICTTDRRRRCRKCGRSIQSKKVYFTEQWVSAHDDFMGALRWHTKNVVIGTLRNWSRTALEWNLASDPRYALHTRRGAVGALGGVTIGATIKRHRGAVGGFAIGATIKRNPGYYLMAHSARFIRPGSVRVHSSEVDRLPNVTCLTPDSRMVMVVMNDADGARRFRVQHRGAYATLELGTGDVATLRWNVATAVAQSEKPGPAETRKSPWATLRQWLRVAYCRQPRLGVGFTPPDRSVPPRAPERPSNPSAREALARRGLSAAVLGRRLRGPARLADSAAAEPTSS